MTPPEPVPKASGGSSPPFLPLAFRFAVSFGLLALHLAIPLESPSRGGDLYLAILAALFAESAWEAGRMTARGEGPFATPTVGWIRLNLVLDMLLVTLIVVFHGVDQERLATIYIFPVLASAFYLSIAGIVAVGLLSSAIHIAAVLLYTQQVLPPFGHSGAESAAEPYQLAYILGFTSLVIFGATLVVLVIRSQVENLRTDLSRSEAVVDELSALYRRVFESMFSGIVITDLRGRVASANPAAAKILHAHLDPGAPVEGYGFGDLQELMAQTRERRFEVSFPGPAGERRIVGGNLSPLLGAEGEPTGHLLVFQDLTEIKALEERTRLSERMAAVGELSSEMAHELRNPLASILGCVQLLKQGGQPPAMVDRVLTILLRESERVSGIVTDFLDYSRPRPVRLQAISLPALAEELRAAWETDPRRGGILLDMEDPPPVLIQGDAAWVHQVFTNLLSNARKALDGAEAPRIRIAFQRLEGRVAARVEDNGCGMTEERRRALFLPFASGFPEGTGLGMSLVFQFIQQMGWEIRVESEVGRGTAVSVEMPVASGGSRAT
ncbi:two-component system sensor histidine kinase NtrB [Mesoterricola sediminis]|nr:ATP-binding protein [Mesoterricola sediminis]